MPELPDVELYLEALRPRILSQVLERVRLGNPFVVRSIEPPIGALEGRGVVELRRVGKRLVFAFEGDLFLVLHLMIAGRLRWREPGQKPGIGPRLVLASFALSNGTLLFTEASSKK